MIKIELTKKVTKILKYGCTLAFLLGAYFYTIFLFFKGYRWDNNEAVVQWLEEQQKRPPGHSIVQYNLHCVKKDAVLNQIKKSLEVSIRLK